jgi:hypothetical protein
MLIMKCCTFIHIKGLKNTFACFIQNKFCFLQSCHLKLNQVDLYLHWHIDGTNCCNPTLRECEDEIHILDIGTWESFGTPKTLEFDYGGQNTLH